MLDSTGKELHVGDHIRYRSRPESSFDRSGIVKDFWLRENDGKWLVRIIDERGMLLSNGKFSHNVLLVRKNKVKKYKFQYNLFLHPLKDSLSGVVTDLSKLSRLIDEHIKQGYRLSSEEKKLYDVLSQLIGGKS